MPREESEPREEPDKILSQIPELSEWLSTLGPDQEWASYEIGQPGRDEKRCFLHFGNASLIDLRILNGMSFITWSADIPETLTPHQGEKNSDYLDFVFNKLPIKLFGLEENKDYIDEFTQEVDVMLRWEKEGVEYKIRDSKDKLRLEFDLEKTPAELKETWFFVSNRPRDLFYWFNIQYEDDSKGKIYLGVPLIEGNENAYNEQSLAWVLSTHENPEVFRNNDSAARELGQIIRPRVREMIKPTRKH